MRSFQINVVILVSSLVLLFGSLFTTTLAAPAIPDITELTAEESSGITSIPTYPGLDHNRRDDLGIATVQGNPDTGEWFMPEPGVKFWSCKPNKDDPHMCTLSYARKTTDSNATLVTYDYNCQRLGDWKRSLPELQSIIEGEKHGSDLTSPNMKWPLIVWLGEDWNPNPYYNYNLKIYYSSYVSFPFFWRDYPEDWWVSARLPSSFWKDIYYDFFRVPYNCGDEHV